MSNLSEEKSERSLAVPFVNCYLGCVMGIARPVGVALEQSHPASHEATLVAELKAGSDPAFAYLLAVYQNPVYNLISHLTGFSADTPDVLQDVFVKVFRGIGHFNGDSSLRTWIYRIAVHEASNHRRGWLRRRLRETFSLDDSESFGEARMARSPVQPQTPYQAAELSERQRLVQQALASVVQPYRSALVLREIEGLSYEEIAQMLEISEGTVKSRLVRGRELLKRKLQGWLGREDV